MPPLWLRFPEISPYSIGWRMGYGESYKWELGEWLGTLSEAECRHYQQLFPNPVFWREYYNEDYEFEDIADYECETVGFWQKNGEMKYTREQITASYNAGEDLRFVCFWKPDAASVTSACLSQWQPSVFEVDIETYQCAEQYMMAEKARLFEDTATEALVMESTDPGQMQRLGKQVRPFEQSLWDKVKYSIVLQGNYYKFSQNEQLRNFLLSTGNAILVEASPLDAIWGIGLAADQPAAHNPNLWRGSNLLGFALMEVRDEIRKVYAHYGTINWNLFS